MRALFSKRGRVFIHFENKTGFNAVCVTLETIKWYCENYLLLLQRFTRYGSRLPSVFDLYAYVVTPKGLHCALLHTQSWGTFRILKHCGWIFIVCENKCSEIIMLTISSLE